MPVSCCDRLWRVETQRCTGILVNLNASGGGYCQVWDATGTLTKHTRIYMEQLFCWRFALITALEVAPVALEGSDDPCSESNSSKFMDGLNLWHAVMCGFSSTFFSRPTAILEQLDAYNYFHCSYVRTILWENDCCMLCWSPVMSHSWQYPPPLAFWFTRIPVEQCPHSS